MDMRRLLPALLLGTALAATGTAALAKEHGGHEFAQHEKGAGTPTRATMQWAAAMPRYRTTRALTMVAEIRITCSSRTRATTAVRTGCRTSSADRI